MDDGSQAREQEALRDQSAQFQSGAAIDGMTWHQFELRVGEAYRQKGYTVVEIGGNGPDGGVDLVLRKPSTNGSEVFLVQCKHWRAYKVSVNVVRELYGVMAARGAAGGFVVTSGRFTSETVAFAQGRHVTLVDGAALKALLETTKLEPHLRPPPSQSVSPELTTMVVCPVCSPCNVAAHRQTRAECGRVVLWVFDVSGVQGDEAKFDPAKSLAKSSG